MITDVSFSQNLTLFHQSLADWLQNPSSEAFFCLPGPQVRFAILVAKWIQFSHRFSNGKVAVRVFA